MPPYPQAQQEQQAVAAARKLQGLLRGAKLRQLLQHAPLAAPTWKQQELMDSCSCCSGLWLLVPSSNFHGAV
jgi:hypothetical protein